MVTGWITASGGRADGATGSPNHLRFQIYGDMAKFIEIATAEAAII